MKQIKPSTTVFFLFMGLFTLLFFILPKQEFSEKEKRYLTVFPEVTAAGVADGTVQSGFEDWFADHFPLRDLWVGVDAYFKLAGGRNAQQEIYLARDGYLIHAPRTSNTEQFVKNLTRFDSFAASTGLPATVLPVPSPGEINDRLLPAGHGDYQNDALYELAGDTLKTARLLDPREALRAANAARPVYYRTDHHLTAYGCHRLYQFWRESLGSPALPETAYTVTAYGGFYGANWSASGLWLTAPDTIELWDSGADVTVTIADGGTEPVVSDSLFFPAHLEEPDKYPVYLDGNHALTTIENPGAAGGTLLVVKDSYAHSFAPFLAGDYQTVYLLDLRFYRGSISGFAKEHGVDELLYLYGIDTLLTDSNSAWLM